MLKLALVCVVFVSVAFATDHEMIDRINSIQNLWTAGHNSITKMKNYKKLLGAMLPEIESYKNDIEINENIPESFDARAHWPNCKSISSIKNQGDCGSCWAVAATSAASDRLCIATNGKISVDLSAEQVISCCKECSPAFSSGCLSGYSNRAWDYIQKTGVVTGGDFGSNEGCQPYEIVPTLTSNVVATPQCQTTCTNKRYKTPFEQDKHHGSSSYFVPSDVSQIQSEILANGPIEANFVVYADFFHYKKGVYVPTTDWQQGVHSVRVLGWGVENGVDYWLVANSWGEVWGDNGLFKIKRGTNECSIESYVTAGLIRH